MTKKTNQHSSDQDMAFLASLGMEKPVRGRAPGSGATFVVRGHLADTKSTRTYVKAVLITSKEEPDTPASLEGNKEVEHLPLSVGIHSLRMMVRTLRNEGYHIVKSSDGYLIDITSDLP